MNLALLGTDKACSDTPSDATFSGTAGREPAGFVSFLGGEPGTAGDSALRSRQTRFAEQSSRTTAAEVETQVLRGVGRRWVEISKSSLKFDMQRDYLRPQTPPFPNAATVAQSFAQARVL